MKRPYHVFTAGMLLVSMALAQSQVTNDAAQRTSTGSTANPGKPQAGEEDPLNAPIFPVAPLPKSKVSLIGGLVEKVDRVRNRVTIRPFGGDKMTIGYDERTHIYRDGVETTPLGIRKGDRIYVDSQLDGPRVFARNLRVVTELEPADARGQVLRYNGERLTIRDDISSQPVTFRMERDTTVRGSTDGATARASDLQPGALIAVKFAADRPNRGVAREITVLAAPGHSFVFAGPVTYLDLSRGMLAVDNRTDQKTYEISFDPKIEAAESLQVGSDVNVTAVFDGKQYKAADVKVAGALEPASDELKDEKKKDEKKDKDEDKDEDK